MSSKGRNLKQIRWLGECHGNGLHDFEGTILCQALLNRYCAFVPHAEWRGRLTASYFASLTPLRTQPTLGRHRQPRRAKLQEYSELPCVLREFCGTVPHLNMVYHIKLGW